MEKYAEYAAPKNPNAAINQFITITDIFSSPLNSIKYRNGGIINAIAADPMEPAIFKKSVKLGISSDTPVISHTIKDLAMTFLAFLLPL